MGTPEIIVLSLVGLSFVIGVVLFFVFWKKPMFPKGERESFKLFGIRVHLILDDVIEPYSSTLLGDCAKAANALNMAWRGRERKGNIKEIVVVFQSPNRFKYMGKAAPNIAAYLTTCSFRIGKGYLPMVYIQDNFIEEVKRTGEPLIHELCHELLGEHAIDGKGHNEKDVWAVFGEDTIQKRAQKNFM